MPNIYFPYLNLKFYIDPIAFELFGLPVYWYGIILTSGIILGTLLAMQIAKKEGLNPDLIIDFILYDIIFALLGARTYYVLFNWDYYKDHWVEIFNLRQGGIAIYGAVLASIVVAIIFTRAKKINFLQFADVAVFGLTLGQIIGRYGNFVNMEAFGDYTNSKWAMRLLKSQAKPPFSENVLQNIQSAFGAEYIQVHPTFFYESTWNVVLLILLFVLRKHKKYHGQLFFMYLIGYGIGRYWVEGLRTDQLLLPILHFPASQLVAILSIIMGIIGIIMCRKSDKTA
ncbi:prolipoprotein diacylglyceryl transferase [Sporanaerobium hydrogeniformans]|uniref:Prolipoprotein diacylglyceryl transferase n=1 Tax=Sporanaerobium hydrogeniformans TaxID=3072179 RepID=A0AC61DE37_9FIRM|nr:prolipoprotein diacylglyceryl transferase [Sporanaerobium hydrogeniformans]PHV71083.1 prolipoprotein diacylglyceryl transferase [Sporanaerobium hydrogeniformans]